MRYPLASPKASTSLKPPYSRRRKRPATPKAAKTAALEARQHLNPRTVQPTAVQILHQPQPQPS
jgi:hypothetical protein